MPTSTLPYEVLFELINDTCQSATVQLAHEDDELGTGATVLLHPRESVSLVLNAGSTYLYTLKERGKEAKMSVKTWKDTQCHVNNVFAANASNSVSESSSSSWAPAEGVTVRYLTRDLALHPCG